MEWLNNVNPLSNEMGCGGVGCSAFCAKKSCFAYQGSCISNVCGFYLVDGEGGVECLAWSCFPKTLTLPFASSVVS